MHDIESAAFASWPALEEEHHRGWILRFSLGYTGRANSVNATSAAEPIGSDDIALIEAAYQARGLAPLFRLTEFHPNPGLDEALAARGYVARDRTLVMTADTSSLPREPDGVNSRHATTRTHEHAAAWLSHFQHLSGKSGLDQQIHLRLLERIAERRMLLVREAEGTPVSCALGVVANGWLGLFDVATAAAQQRRGHGRALCRDLLSQGRAEGVDRAYLQVLESNGAAIALYRSLGFEVAYRYWYRSAPA